MKAGHIVVAIAFVILSAIGVLILCRILSFLKAAAVPGDYRDMYSFLRANLNKYE